MKLFSVLIAASVLTSLTAWAVPPKTATRDYMFNITSQSAMVPGEAEVEKSINLSVKGTLAGYSCFARAKLLTYVPAESTFVAHPYEKGIAVASLTANCKEAADALIKRWREDASLEVFENSAVIGPWPAVSPGN
jgi:hypothetical protein